MSHPDTSIPISHPDNLIEDTKDLAQRLPVLERAVLGMIMLGFNQVEIACLLQERKNTISTIKIRARQTILEQYFE